MQTIPRVISVGTREHLARHRASLPPDMMAPALAVGETLENMPGERLLNVEQVLALLPWDISRRVWTDGVRAGRFPAPSASLTRKTRYWRADSIRAMISTAGR
ncbi:helix-turn-helix transcriptional regulator [Paraburkholderia sp. HD33-4]|uniref:helix-turn-helix transcriptional regulator n=1 Tax=Paraburkholderia sp. HD33-4 TaxID=2883242 RepID=UPI001F469578|nr:hypothetical protein [Paraburkholderia sp. HD33-4]